MYHPPVFTPQMIGYIKEIANGRRVHEIVGMVNEKFGMDLQYNQVRAAMKNRKIYCNVDAEFKPGQASWNKGKKHPGGYNRGSFKKGDQARHICPVGFERTRSDGYIEVKTANPHTWRMKHIVLWETVNGPVPDCHVLMFKDHDRSNISLDNLMLVSRGRLSVLNKNKIVWETPEQLDTGIIIADIHLAIGEKKRRLKK